MNNMFGNNCRNNCRDNKSDMDWRDRRREHGMGCDCNRNNERGMHHEHRMDNEDHRMRNEHRHMHRRNCWDIF